MTLHQFLLEKKDEPIPLFPMITHLIYLCKTVRTGTLCSIKVELLYFVMLFASPTCNLHLCTAPIFTF